MKIKNWKNNKKIGGPAALLPLIDLAFLVTAVLTMTATLLEMPPDQLSIQLPEGKGDDKTSSVDSSPLIITVSEEGIFLDSQKISLDELRIKLSKMPSKRIVSIRGDARVSYQKIIDVLGVLQEAGIGDISFEVREVPG